MQFLFIISFLYPCFLQAIVIDDFTDLARSSDYDSSSDRSVDHKHNSFIDSKGKTISITRCIAELADAHLLADPYSSYFTPTMNKLHYDRSVTKGGSYMAPNEISYRVNYIDQWDMTSTPKLKINFHSYSKPFLINISLVNSGPNEITMIKIDDFLINSLNPTIDIPRSEVNENDLANITHISFIMNTKEIPDLTFDISSIEAVPEPFSMIGLGTGIAAFIRKRKSKQKEFFNNN